MWKIYIISAVWLQFQNAQYVEGTKNNLGGGGGQETSTVRFADVYFKHYFNISQNAKNKSFYNKKSGDSFEYTNTSKGYQSFPEFTTIKPTAWKTPMSNSFNSKLFDAMSSKSQHENLVFSPFSLQILFAFIFTMSDGKLHEELAQLLDISNNRTYIVEIENKLQKALNNTLPTLLVVANKLYYDHSFGSIDQSVRLFNMKSLGTEIEEINFSEPKKAAKIINSWISKKTHNLIEEIAEPSSVSEGTSALLLNALYFKSEWLTKFSTLDTEKQEFFLTKQTRVPVDMMYNEDVFCYGDFTEDLQASVLKLPYKTSNLSMLLILPHDIEGLVKLEQKLRYYDLNIISNKLKREIVTVKLPRFKIEYEVDMMSVLQELGITTFSNALGEINIFKNQRKLFKIDQLKHKSFINVNEAGTEAAATTVAKYVPLSIPNDMKYFVVDHPFVFIIRDPKSIFFAGHLVQF